MKREILLAEKAKLDYDRACNVLEAKIREVCDFDAYLTWCAGDGHLVGNNSTANVAPLYCLDGKSKSNKLTQEDHYSCCI